MFRFLFRKLFTRLAAATAAAVLLLTAMHAPVSVPVSVPGLVRGTAAAAARTSLTIMPGTEYATTLHIIDGSEPGSTVFVTGGVHGSELAGWHAADKIKNWTIGRGRLAVLPRANAPAVRQEKRAAAGDPDLNRQFPSASGSRPKTALARAIWDEIERLQPDWFIDLHEALGTRNLSKDSVGQTFISCGSTALPEKVLADMNARGLPKNHDFQLLRNPVQGSVARAACSRLNISGGIFETWRKPALSQRVNYHLEFVERMLDELGMEPRRS